MVEGEDTEKWVKHYVLFHQILLVGEGDFSFSLCLARSFGSAFNMVSTSLDSYEELIRKYRRAKSNLEELKNLGGSVLYGVDATRMKLHTDLKMRKFDRIIFNFPHAGFIGREHHAYVINMHMNLIDGFFHNAAGILRPDGEIHISHKTSHPFCNWNLNKLASKNSLALLQCVDFNISDYPGYDNKRGSGSRCDDPFPLGECSTFKFIISASAIRKSKNLPHFNTEIAPVHQFMQVPPQQSPIFLSSMSKIAWLLASRMGDSLREQCFHDFDWYFRHVRAILGFCDHNVRHVVQEALKGGYKRYLKESCETTSKGYVVLPEELHQLSISSRLAWLEMTLADNT